MSLSLRPGACARPTLFFLTLLAAFVLAGFAARQASATPVTYYVATVSAGNGSGSSWSNASSNLQGIITAAHSGDQVWVKYGTYTGNFTATDGVAVYGHFAGTETSTGARKLTTATYLTTLDGNGNGTVYAIPSAATGTNTLDGFTVQGGTSRGINDPSSDHLVIANCTIQNNSVGGGFGGGLYTTGVTAAVTNCFFSGNAVNGNQYQYIVGGGAFFGSSTTATVSTCYFTGNSANPSYDTSGGGALDSEGTATITGTTFGSNNASSTGGALRAVGNAITVTGCTFTGNNPAGGIDAGATTNTISNSMFTSNSGRGVTVGGTNTTIITGCKFNNNSVSGGNGGGLYTSSVNSTVTGCTFTGNYINGNQYETLFGGGMYAEAGTTATISQCMFSGNYENTSYTNAAYGGGIGAFGTPAITRCTFMNDSPDEIDVENVGNPPSEFATIKDNLIYGNGTGGITQDGNNNAINIATQGLSTTYAYVTVANNTILDANAGINIGANSGATGEVDVANNIFYDNNGAVNDNSSVTFVSSHNDLSGNTYTYQGSGIATSGTDLSHNPAFIRYPNYGASPPDYGDLHLQSTSLLIDAGDDSYVSSGDTDRDGNARIQGNAVDIGAYEAAPNSAATLTGISPSTVQAGDDSFTLTVTGTGFASGAKVDWNGTLLTTTVVSSTQATAVVPASLVATAGTVNVSVDNPGMNPSNAKTLTITAAATLTSLSPASEPAGSATFTLTLHGTGFVSGATVSFNGNTLTATEVSSTELTAVVPASDITAPGAVSVTAANPHTAPTSALTFMVTTPIATLTSLSPSSVQVGSATFTLTLTGTYFVSGATVKWGSTTLTSAYLSATTFVAIVPSSLLATAGTASVTVVNPRAAASNAVTFTITAIPAPATLTSLSPSSVQAGSAGFTLTLTGTGFVSGAVVKWNGTTLTSAYFNATTFAALVPSSLLATAGTASVTVTNPGVAASNAVTFTIKPAPPTITSFTPASGPVGTVVTVTGTNLSGVTAVRFHNANAATFSANAGGTQMTVTVPTGAGTGTITVTTPGGSATSSGTFTVN